MERTRKAEINRGLVCLSRIIRELHDESEFNQEADVAALLREAAIAVQSYHKRIDNLLFAEMKREREQGAEMPGQAWDRMVEAGRVK